MEDFNDPDFKILNIDSVKYKTLFTKKFNNRKAYVQKNPKEVYAFISGEIRKIFVSSKKKVKAGDKLLELEAMKMKNEILAPIDGVIEKIHVSTGDHVNKGQLLVEFL